jgi:hypothetical protein
LDGPTPRKHRNTRRVEGELRHAYHLAFFPAARRRRSDEAWMPEFTPAARFFRSHRRLLPPPPQPAAPSVITASSAPDALLQHGVLAPFRFHRSRSNPAAADAWDAGFNTASTVRLLHSPPFLWFKSGYLRPWSAGSGHGTE